MKLQSAYQSTTSSTYTRTIKFRVGLFYKIRKYHTHFNSLHFYEIKKVGFLVDEFGGWRGVYLPFGCPIVNLAILKGIGSHPI